MGPTESGSPLWKARSAPSVRRTGRAGLSGPGGEIVDGDSGTCLQGRTRWRRRCCYLSEQQGAFFQVGELFPVSSTFLDWTLKVVCLLCPAVCTWPLAQPHSNSRGVCRMSNVHSCKGSGIFPRQYHPPELDLRCICPYFLVLVNLLLPSTGSFLCGGGFTRIKTVVISGLMWAPICGLPRGNLVPVLILKKRWIQTSCFRFMSGQGG